MSVYKGAQLIAGKGLNGADGSDGEGIVLEATACEIHNNLDKSPGQGSGRNSIGTSCAYSSVGGYRSEISDSGNSITVFGYRCVGGGQGYNVEGYENTGTGIGSHCEGYDNTAGEGQGYHLEGNSNSVSGFGRGAHVEGLSNTFSGLDIPGSGTHIEGSGHTSVIVTNAGHQGGKSIGVNTPRPTMPATQEQSLLMEAIGGGTEASPKVIRTMNIGGDMGITGDFSFVAKDSNGNVIGTFSLGQIVDALINEGILPDPRI